MLTSSRLHVDCMDNPEGSYYTNDAISFCRRLRGVFPGTQHSLEEPETAASLWLPGLYRKCGTNTALLWRLGACSPRGQEKWDGELTLLGNVSEGTVARPVSAYLMLVRLCLFIQHFIANRKRTMSLHGLYSSQGGICFQEIILMCNTH